jgi:Major intrinsic protein
MYDLPAVTVPTTTRGGWHLFLSEIIATAGLVALIFALARSGRAAVIGPAVAAYIGAAYWFTASTSFANPAVTIGRMFSDTFARIAPSSVPLFIAAQVIGAAIGTAVTVLSLPDSGHGECQDGYLFTQQRRGYLGTPMKSRRDAKVHFCEVTSKQPLDGVHAEVG